MFNTTRSEVLRARNRRSQLKDVPIDSGRFALCRENNKARNLSSSEPPRMQGFETEILQPPSSPPTLIVLVLDEVRRDYFQKACQARPQNLRGREVWSGKGKITNRSMDDPRKPANRRVQPSAGRSVTISDGGGVHRGVQRSQGCGVGQAVHQRNPPNGLNATSSQDGQRRSIPSRTNNQLPQKEPSHRPPIPLPEATNPQEVPSNEYYTREGESCRYPHENSSNECSTRMEEDLDVIDWDVIFGGEILLTMLE